MVAGNIIYVTVFFYILNVCASGRSGKLRAVGAFKTAASGAGRVLSTRGRLRIGGWAGMEGSCAELELAEKT